MAQVILTNWTIYFADDAPAASSGYKQIRWTGGGGPETNTNTVNQLYSEIMHYFSLAANNDFNDTIPMKYVTPTVYQIGSFDAGDIEPWFIDPESVKHLTGGSLETIGWTRTATNSGIVKVPYTTGTQFVSSDIGRTVTHTAGDSGTLLWFDSANNEAWIRPASTAVSNNWDSTTGTISVTSGTGSVTQTGAAVTGERLWSNINTIGTISTNTRIYVAQNNIVLSNFWGDGNSLTNHIDRLFLINDGFDAGLIDSGLLTVYARQFTETYDHFVADVSSGGRTAIPLSTQNELNNPNGYRTVSVSSASSAFSIDEVVTGGTSGAKAIVTANTGSPTTSFQYYLIGNLTDFSSGETLTGSIVGSNGTVNGSPSNVNSATYTDIVIEFGSLQQTFHTNTGVNGGSEVITLNGIHPWETGEIVEYYKRGGTDVMGLSEGTLYYVRDLDATTISLHISAADASSDTSRVNLTASGGSETHLLKRVYDLDANDVRENYSIIINGAGRSLSEIFEYTKYLTRRGSTTSLNGIQGQQYKGIDYKVNYTALTGTIVAGNTLTQSLSNGNILTTTVVHHNEIDKYLMLRNTKNSPFDTGGGAANLQIDGSNFVTMTSATTSSISPNKSAPFGTFAGGTFFGSRGVYLENIDSLESNNIQLIDDGGSTKTPPITVTFQLTGLIPDSEVRIYNTSNGNEITGTESSGTTFSYQYEYASDITAHIIIHHIDYIWQRINGITLSSANQSIPIQQQTDRNYANQ